jgi:hypothetical protein
MPASPAVPEPAPADTDKTINPAVLSAPPNKRIYVTPEIGDISVGDVLLLNVDTGNAAPVAIWRRGGFVYMLLDKKPSSLADLQRATPLVNLENVETADGRVIRFYLPQDVGLRIARNEGVWSISATQRSGAVPISLSLSPEPGYAAGARLVVAAPEAGIPFTFYDPEIGDQLTVIPMPDPGQAVRQDYRLADLRFIGSEQGIVLQPHTGNLVVTNQAGTIEISKPGGLRLSPERDTGVSAGKPLPGGVPRMFDIAAWQGPPDTLFIVKRQRMQRALAEAPVNDRDRMTLEMAHFFFAHDHAQEAIGLLSLLSTRLPDINKHPEFMALRGAVRVLTRDPQGVQDLQDPAIADHPEVKLWRAAGLAQMGRWREAMELFSVVDGLLAVYPDPFFVPFSLLAVDAGLASDKQAYAADVLDRLVQKKPELEETSAAVSYLRGIFISAAGHLERAEDLWKRAAASKDQLTRVRAQLALTDLYVLEGKIKPLKAAERLERLRFAWRGDDLELDILRRLGKFYIEAGKVEEGLAALKQVLGFLPEKEAAQELRAEMANAFRDVFLGDMGRNISPLDALSLYERFHELAPQGEEGDAIIRVLAERMVAVDLLERAGALLADQARNRLTGAMKAKLGAQAAGIYLLDRRDDSALGILNDSEDAAAAPELQRERLLLKAKALAGLGKSAEALQLLQTDSGEEALRLKADIAWATRDWPTVSATLESLIGPPPATELPPEKAQLLINRAVAMAMANDLEGLKRLRASFGGTMKGTKQADLFKILTEPEAGLVKDPVTMQSLMADVDLFHTYLDKYRSLK